MTTTQDPNYITTTDPTVKLRKADGRYYVEIEGVKVGWVLNWHDGTGWSFFATVRESLKGERLAWGTKTRRDAVMEGVSSLKCWHGGGVYILNLDTIKDELVVFSSATLDAILNRLLDEKYPMA